MQFQLHKFQLRQQLGAFFAGRSRRISLWIWLPSPSRFEGDEVLCGRERRVFLTITAPCAAKTLSDFCKGPSPEGAAEGC